VNLLNKQDYKQKFTIPVIIKVIEFSSSLTIWYLLNNNPVKAQISPDQTVNTQVNTVNNVTEITGGTEANDNLFHSFQNFSLETGNTAFFNNNLEIKNIISRVTGVNISNIDGLIRANGNANLILINPNGINFGGNASLDIGGSFLGSTADSVVFADGTVFSAKDTQANPLLTISVPLGLQIGQNSGDINVSGEGHNLSIAEPIFSPFTIGEVSGLEVREGQTLALVGGNLNINGGNITAKGGRIELGSTAEGTVNLNPFSQGWKLSYENVPIFQNINMSRKALADASGIKGGSIQIQGKEVLIANGSTILIQNQSNQGSGNLIVNASESLKINGTTAKGEFSSGLFTEALGTSEGGELVISTPKLVIEDGGAILTDTFGDAKAGDVKVNASESLEIIGFSVVNPNRFSIITAQTFGSGKAGDINIATKHLTALNGGNIASVTGGASNTGTGGQVKINASESVELIGVTPGLFTPSQITAGTGSAGDAGNVTVDTQRLTVRDGGRIDASTTATGNAGSVIINATESIEVSGTVPGSINPSLIISSANILDPALQALLKLPPIPSGNSGDVTINTSQLNITDGGLITTRNDGLGNSGSIQINADSIFLNNDGGITSEIGSRLDAFSGNGGSFPGNLSFDNNSSPQSAQNSVDTQGGGIDISTQELLIKGGANISTNTFTDITGGDITINAAENIQVQGFSAANPTMLSFISTSSFGSGDAGDLDVSTGKLTILDGGRVGAGTFGTGLGDAGRLQINANSILLDNQGNLSAATKSGVGGNITLLADNVFLRGRSTTTATAEGDGNGGNISINANNLVALDSSQITANANQGAGGNIQIDTKGIYYICTECKITASSQLGVDGIVSIETLEPNTQLEILNVPQQPSQAQEIVAVGCPATNQTNSSQLTITGRGGLAARPQGTLSSESLINFDAPRSEIKQPSTSAINNTSKLPSPARGWYRDAQGTVILSAQIPNVVNNSVITTPNCHSVPNSKYPSSVTLRYFLLIKDFQR
jgi:filamentous hemagglutinin family protein